MNRDQIDAAEQEAHRFLERVTAARDALEFKHFNKGIQGGYWTNNDTSATAALKRASMDLTRALADLRRPR